MGLENVSNRMSDWAVIMFSENYFPTEINGSHRLH